MSDTCANCGGPKSVRNPTGACDHLCWPEYLTPEAKRKVAQAEAGAPAISQPLMSRYKVHYYYLATGMEGHADEKYYGIVEASSPDDARDRVACQEYPEDKMYGPNDAYSTRDFFRSCLAAKLA